MNRVTVYLTAFFLLVGPVYGKEGDIVTADSNIKVDSENASVMHTVSTTYVIKNGGEKIGEIASIRQISGEADDYIVEVKDDLTIHVESFWSNYSLSSSETMKLNQVGLFEYRGKYLENGNPSKINAVVQDSKLSIDAKGDGDDLNIQLDVSDYDATSEDAPWRFLRSGKSSSELKVLDLDDFEVKTVNYTNQGTHPVEIANHHFNSHRIQFKSKEKSGEQWLVEDETGVWLLKETGKDSDGDYVIQLTAFKREPTSK